MVVNQRRSTAKKSVGLDKENVPVINLQRNCTNPRPSKATRLSDRWPVLNRLIRSTKSGAASLDDTSSADLSGASSNPENSSNCTGVSLQSNDMSASSPEHSHRILHPSSPRFPSPLSGVCPESRLLAARHSYPHRGHSQSSLYLQRHFWRKRKGDWDDYEFSLDQAELSVEIAYGGIVEYEHGPLPRHLRNKPRNQSQSSAPRDSSGTGADRVAFLNYSTYPRLGDLASIRDPFLFSVDTWFSSFPLWTLSKLCWIYDVNFRSSHSARTRGSGLKRTNAFARDFSMNDSSVDDLSFSGTDFGDTTLIETSTALSHSPDRRLERPVCSPVPPEHTLSSSPSLVSLGSVNDHDSPWERDWFSRWEVLYNQVSLAIDIAASNGHTDPLVNASKEAARIIMTSPGILYDPSQSGTSSWRADEQGSDSEYSGDDTSDLITPTDEDEEDYGRIIPRSESVYRVGAQVDPFSMFATATPEPPQADDTNVDDYLDSYRSEDFSDQMLEDFEQLAIYS